MISLDTEDTGTDFHHGAMPFFVTTCDEEGEQRWWEWDVDPLTRRPDLPKEDVESLKELVDQCSITKVVLQNAKFDVKALDSVGIEGWPWHATFDTLLAGHLLASNQPHDLTSMALRYLGVDIAPLEEKLKVAVNEARRYCRSHLPDWAIAKEGRPDMPSAGEKTWRYDYWLPRAIAQELNHPGDHPWWTVLRDYSNADSAVTLSLWKVMRKEIEKRGLWKIYLERLKLLPIAYEMEQHGVTLSRIRLEELRKEYAAESIKAGKVCVSIAASFDYDLNLPKGANNNSLREFCFGPLNLPPFGRSKKTGEPSLDKSAMEHYEATLPASSRQLAFVKALRSKRKRDTALSYMEGYERFWQSLGGDWYLLHPSVNPTGTDTLRWSHSNPNSANVSRQEEANLRYLFGPAPGREWWKYDAENLELRIPGFEAEEPAMMDLFTRRKDPPYFGSYHLLIFDILHPEKFAKYGVKCKDVYKATWYRYTKNGNFAVTYGAVEESGTADRAYHVPGAQHKIKERLSNLSKLNQKYIDLANKNGYVETIPDRAIDPKHGYPLLCTRSEYGRVLPTVPLNYHVQGTAMWWMMKAMIRCFEYLKSKPDYHIVLQVHDELVFDFPKGRGDSPWMTNLPVIRKIQELMEQGGDDIGVPTPVSVEYHADNWSEGMAV